MFIAHSCDFDLDEIRGVLRVSDEPVDAQLEGLLATNNQWAQVRAGLMDVPCVKVQIRLLLVMNRIFAGDGRGQLGVDSH